MPTNRTVTTDAPSDFRQHPLKEFKGTISDITDEPLSDNNPNRFRIIFHISELEVIESNEPFNFPVTQVAIAEFNFPKTEWAALTESIRNAGYTGDINGLIGKRTHWKHAPATLNQRVSAAKSANPETGEPAMPAVYNDVQGNAWQILSIEGIENTTNDLVDKVVEIADGKDAVIFKSAFMSDMSLQGLTNYNEIAQQVMQNTALDFLVSINKLTFDGSVYHKVVNDG